MARYSIEDTTLTAIGDAIREKTGNLTRIETQIIEVEAPLMEVVKSSNATGLESYEGKFNNPGMNDIYTPITLTGATSIKVKLGYKSSGHNYYVVVIPGAYTEETWPGAGSATRYYGDQNIVELTFENTDSVTIFWHHGVNISINGFYYAECYPLDASGNIPTETIEKEIEVEVTNTLTPSQMATEISTIETGTDLPESAFKITGNCKNRFSFGGWDWFIELFGDKITTENISSCSNMFAYSNIEYIPFDINISTSNYNIGYMFSNCQYLKELPRITVDSKITVPTSKYNFLDLSSFCDYCYCIREIPDDYFDSLVVDGYMEARETLKADGKWSMVSHMYSLRKIPTNLYKSYRSYGTESYFSMYNNIANSCYSLDEIVDLPVEPGPYTSNCFSGMVSNCYRLKRFTFETNEDGTPKTVNWKGQTIFMGGIINVVGYVYPTFHKNNILNYNSGITADKEVTDAASYEALKNDPDWFTSDESYSRYNKLSALETIATLPDCSASGGTNTIIFRGVAGQDTDGGAINTMTEEEIAVAAAKGWTVSFV